MYVELSKNENTWCEALGEFRSRIRYSQFEYSKGSGMKKKETRGRKPKVHAPVPASFDEVLGALASSEYKDKKDLKTKKKK